MYIVFNNYKMFGSQTHFIHIFDANYNHSCYGSGPGPFILSGPRVITMTCTVFHVCLVRLFVCSFECVEALMLIQPFPPL